MIKILFKVAIWAFYNGMCFCNSHFTSKMSEQDAQFAAPSALDDWNTSKPNAAKYQRHKKGLKRKSWLDIKCLDFLTGLR